MGKVTLRKQLRTPPDNERSAREGQGPKRQGLQQLLKHPNP